MSIFSNINVFDDHLMYHKTTRSYLERSGNPEKFPKKEKASKKSENRNVFARFSTDTKNVGTHNETK